MTNLGKHLKIHWYLVAMAVLLMGLPNSRSAWATVPAVPSDFVVLMQGRGVELWTDNNSNYVQVINLRLGASVTLPAGPLVVQGPRNGDYGGFNPSFRRQHLAEFWSGFTSGNPGAFCITNGQFFADQANGQIIDPTTLAFSLKQDGHIVSDGYAVGGSDEEYPGQRLMLAIWNNRVDISPLSQNNLLSSTAPNIIAGLTEDANKGVLNPATPRTFVGIDDANGDGQFETIAILNSAGSTQLAAAAVLRSFGADKVMMLDGGASTQLICRDQSLLASSRTIPQVLAVSESDTASGAAQIGISWLEQAAVTWQNQSGCIGCHVQSKAIQAASIAKDNGFTIDLNAVNSLMSFMKSQQGGAGDFCCWPIGEEHHAAPGFAAYDRSVSGDAQANLVSLANWFITAQQVDGRWAIDRHEPPVDQGDFLSTANAVTALAQAYNRTADVRFSTAMQLGALWLEENVSSAQTTQDRAHLIIGLIASGRPATDSTVQAAVDDLVAEQRQDGGWQDSPGGNSTAYGTGQALYALRLAGMRLDDPVLANGVRWLKLNQEAEGSWPLTDNSDPGRRSKFSPTMWGVLGLVQSVDLAPPTITVPIIPLHVPKWSSMPFQVFDNSAGSNINPASIVVKLDGLVVPSFYIPLLNRVIVFVDPEETHTLTVDASDNQGNAASQVQLTFTVDAGLLGVVSTLPPHGAINVPLDGGFQATFNSDVDGSTVNTATVMLHDDSQQQLTGSVTFDPASHTATFQPNSPLEPHTYYVLTVVGDAEGVHAASGQAMVMDFQFGFRTRASSGDVTPPTVTALDVEEDGSFKVHFSEPMDPFSVNGSTVLLRTAALGLNVPKTVSYDAAANLAVLMPDDPLDPGMSYQLRVLAGLGGVADVAGNPMEVDYAYDLWLKLYFPFVRR